MMAGLNEAAGLRSLADPLPSRLRSVPGSWIAVFVVLLAGLTTGSLASAEELRNVRIRVTTRFDDASRSRASSSRTQGVVRQEILTLAGAQASLRVARETPYADWFWTWVHGHGLLVEGTAWQAVGTSLVVEPTLLGDGRIRLRLVPRLDTVAAGGSPAAIDVVELATEVVVAPGVEVDLGGTPMSDTTFRERFFLGIDEGGRTSRVALRVSATVE